MRRSSSSPELAAALVALALAGCQAAAPRPDPGQHVACTAGPVAADFGALPWLAFACDDGRSVALIAAPGNAAAPFSFVVRPSDHGVRVQGDGAGDRAATAAAFAELMALDDEALAHLYDRALLDADPGG
jgi:hypothetical protein